MSKFNPYKHEQSHSTNHSGTSTNLTPRVYKEKYVSPFPGTDRCASPLQKRVANSPLHIPLAIALRKLVSKGSDSSRERQGIPHNNSQNQPRYQSPCLNHSQLQNIKNILQQFAQSLYITIERQLYAKFNVEMKRMVVKYRQTEKLLKKVQEKLIMNADILELEQSYKALRQKEKRRIEELESNNREISSQLARQKRLIDELMTGKQRLEFQNSKMSLKLQKFENMFLKRMEEFQVYENSMNKSKLSLQRVAKPKQEPRSSVMANYHHSEQPSMMNSYVLNVNQLPPSQSPIQKKRMKIKDFPIRPSEVPIMLE